MPRYATFEALVCSGLAIVRGRIYAPVRQSKVARSDHVSRFRVFDQAAHNTHSTLRTRSYAPVSPRRSSVSGSARRLDLLRHLSIQTTLGQVSQVGWRHPRGSPWSKILSLRLPDVRADVECHMSANLRGSCQQGSTSVF